MKIDRINLDNSELIFNNIREVRRMQAIDEAEKISDRFKHDVMNTAKFPDKTVYNTEYKIKDGDQLPTATIVKKQKQVIRTPIDFNNYAIRQKGTLTCGAGVGVDVDDQDSKLYIIFYDHYENLKLEYFFQEVAETMMNETQCAVIFFNDEKGAYKKRIVSPSRGDLIEPIFDNNTDDMVGFVRQYLAIEDTYTDIYLDDGSKVLIKRYKNETWEKDITTPYRKLPIVYFEQSHHELWHTTEIYSLWEKEYSRFNESCEYFSDPIMYVKGSKVDLPTSTDRGQVIQSTGVDGDAKILTPANATDTRELQFSQFEKYMHKLNFVAPLDFDSLKGTGSIAASTLELLMTDAYMDATRRQNGKFGEGVQRIFNWLKDELSRLNNLDSDKVKIKPKFRRYSLRGEAERIDMYLKANGGLPLIGHQESAEVAGIASDTSFVTDVAKVTE